MIRYLIVSIFASVSSEMVPFIVGGEYASISDWPFIAFLALVHDDRRIVCGGSLISSQTVLTAAHCVVDYLRGDKQMFYSCDMHIYMGHTAFLQATMKRAVIDYHAHEQYVYTESNSDICMLFLDNPVKFSHNVKKSILVPVSHFSYNEKNLEVAGWGRTSIFKQFPDKERLLKSLSQQLMDIYKCHILSSKSVQGEVLCATGTTAHPYSGDSGGPLVRKSDSFQVGIVSTRLEGKGITTYVSIPHYFQWIEAAQKKLFDINCPKKHFYEY